MLERSFFEQVLDAFEGLAAEVGGELHSSSHRRGLKVWYGEAKREHYEAQLIRHDGEVSLEIGFHAEHSDPARNDEILESLHAVERRWRKVLGDHAEAGVFLGADNWRRISEVWEAPDADDPEAPIEIAARLADYALAIEPLRR